MNETTPGQGAPAMTDDLRHRIARALADHEQQDLALDADRYPIERWLCCADAVIAAVGPVDERTVRDQVAAEIRAYAAGLHSASEPTWYGGMADAADLAAGVDPQELHRRNAEAVKLKRGWK